MDEKQMAKLALVICAAMDDGEPCGAEPCISCVRQARAAVEFVKQEMRPRLTLVKPPAD